MTNIERYNTMQANKGPPKYYQKCLLPQCSGYRYEMCHKFPQNIKRCKAWLRAFDNPKLNAYPFERLSKKFICSRHFRVKDYVHDKSNKLNFVAVPNLNLKELNELDKCRQTDMILSNKAETDLELKENVEELQNPLIDRDTVNELYVALEEEINAIGDDIRCNDGNNGDSVTLNQHDAFTTVVTKNACPTTSAYIEEFSENFRLCLKDGFMLIIDTISNLRLNVDLLWLRHLCRCQQCFDNKEARTIKNFFELSCDLQPALATTVEENGSLDIIWNDGHASTYSLIELYDKFRTKQQKALPKYLPWNHQHTQYRDDLQPIYFLDLIQMNNDIIYKAMDCLQKSGVLVIKFLPKNDSDSLVKRSIVSKLFNYLFDNLTTEKRTSFSAKETMPCTNCTFESLDKGLQILSIPHHKGGTKIKFILVDGFQAIEQLPKTSYEYLREFKVSYNFKDNKGFEHIVQRVVIEEDDVLKRIWFSPLHLHDIKSEDFVKAVEHFKILGDFMKMPQNQWLVEADNETLIILD